MLYALNVFNLVDGADDAYKRYAVNAGRLLQRVGGSVVVAGRRPVRMLEGDRIRTYFMVVQFLDEGAFADFLTLIETEEMHPTRQACTKDYIWTVYEAWDLAAWVRT